MFAVNQVYYFKQEVFLMLAGEEKPTVVPYRLKSTTSSLISEEISAFIKQSTQLSFLHSNDFDHWTISDKFMLLPTTVYEPQLKTSYWERMFGALPQDQKLEEYCHKSLKIQFLYTVPEWLTGFLKMQFNKPRPSCFFSEMLRHSPNQGKQMALLITSDSFVFALYSEKEMHYFDISSYQAVDDILYTMLHVLHRQPWALEHPELTVYGFCAASLLQELQTGLRKVQAFEPLIAKELIHFYP